MPAIRGGAPAGPPWPRRDEDDPFVIIGLRIAILQAPASLLGIQFLQPNLLRPPRLVKAKTPSQVAFVSKPVYRNEIRIPPARELIHFCHYEADRV